MTTATFTRYKKRPIRHLGNRLFRGWTLKLYSISARGERVPDRLMAAAEVLIAEALPQQAFTDSHYGAAIVILHEGLDGNYVIVNWWEGENMICQQVYGSYPDDAYRFLDLSPTKISSCVWEMEILYFEKKAWTTAILMNAERPDFERYYSMHYNGEI